MSGSDAGAPPGVALIKSGVWYDNDVQMRSGTVFTTQQTVYSPQTTTPNTPSTGNVVYSQGGGLFTKDTAGNVYTLQSPSLDQSAPTPGALTETCHRYTVTAGTTPNNGTLYLMAITLVAGMRVNNIGFCIGSTSGVGPQNWWGCIVNASYLLRATTADQTTTPINANTWYKLALTSTYVPQTTGQHYIGLMFNCSGTRPNLISPTFTPSNQFAPPVGINIPTPLLGGLSSTGLTSPGTPGVTTYIAPTQVAPVFYAYCS